MARHTGFALSALFALLLAPALALAEPKAWDQTEVKRIAGHLNDVADEIKKNLSTVKETVDETTPRGVVIHDVFRIQHLTLALVGALNAGLGRSETEPLVRRINQAVENAQRDAEAYPEIQKQSAHLRRGGELLAELNAYYQD